MSRSTSAFYLALCDLIELPPRHHPGRNDGRRARMVAALNYRVPYATIRNWTRENGCRPPAWAIELVREKLAKREAHDLSGRSWIARAVAGRGQAWQRPALAQEPVVGRVRRHPLHGRVAIDCRRAADPRVEATPAASAPLAELAAMLESHLKHVATRRPVVPGPLGVDHYNSLFS